MKKVVAAIILWLMFMLILQIPVQAQIAPLANDIVKVKGEVAYNVEAQWLGTELIPMDNDNPMKVYGKFHYDGKDRNRICEVPAVFNDIIMYCIGTNIPTVVSLIMPDEWGSIECTLDSISIQ